MSEKNMGEHFSSPEQRKGGQERFKRVQGALRPGFSAEKEQITTSSQDKRAKINESSVLTKEVTGREVKDVKDSREKTYKGPEQDAEMEPLARKLRAIEGLSPERWHTLRVEQRMQVMRDAHNQIATEYGFKPREIKLFPPTVSENLRGSCTTDGININPRLVGGDNPQDALRTLAHESRHAYQYHVINQQIESLPKDRRELAKEWSENFANYRRPEISGFKAYFNQPVEADARKFANEVIYRTYGGKL